MIKKFMSHKQLHLLMVVVAVLVCILLMKDSLWPHLLTYIKSESHINKKYTLTYTNDNKPIIVSRTDKKAYDTLRMFGRKKCQLYKHALMLIKPTDCVLEIGSGYGYSTIYIAPKLVDNGHLICYDASSEMCRCLIKTLALNDLLSYDNQHIEIRNIGLSHKKQTAFLAYKLTDTEACYVTNKLVRNREGQHTTLYTLDSQQLPPINVMILDNSGSELDILLGARQTLRDNPNMLILLQWNYRLLQFHGKPLAQLEKILEQGYQLYKFCDNKIQRASKQELINNEICLLITKNPEIIETT